MNSKSLFSLILVLILIFFSNGYAADSKKITVDINKEDKDVGMKRMELIDKALSPELIEKKRVLVQNIEADYNQKIKELIDSIISPIFNNKVLTHIDVNFFVSDFEVEVKSTQKVSVAIILNRDGFNTWAKQKPNQDALKILKQLIENTFKISDKNISVLVVN
ncbi:MAG: hypothetical protein HQK76_15700 [Desulfobacterales bacterium]|nr:hypothetical protein [Desulfobacterales bacterium]